VREESIENEIREDVAESYVPSLAIATRNVQEPALTNETTPVDDPTVHTVVEVLVYVLVPVPTEAVLVRVGGVSLTPYEE
jgi:hypothetical protein